MKYSVNKRENTYKKYVYLTYTYKEQLY